VQQQQNTPPGSETIVIKSILANQANLVTIAAKLDTRDFTYRPYQILYNAIKHLAANATVINGDSIMAWLEAKAPNNFREIQAVGGAPWIDSLYDETYAGPVNLDEHIDAILTASFNRRLYNVALQLYNLSVSNGTPDNPLTVDKKLSEAQQQIYGLMQSTVRQKDVPTLGHSIQDTISGLLTDDDSVKGISIAQYMPRFDDLIKRMQPGRVVLLSSEEKVGKTTLCLDLAWTLAGLMKIPVAYADSEMTEAELHMRLLSKVTGYSQHQLQDANFAREHEEELRKVGQYIAQAPIYRFDCSTMSEYEVEATVKLLQVKHGIRALLWDYPKVVGNSTERLDKALGNKIAVAKNRIANDCGIWVFCPMQRNADTGRIADSKEPNRYADMVLKFDRVTPEEQEKINNLLATHKLTIEVARYRSNEGVVYLQIDAERQRIREV
jgi:replicative DNA helicase